MAALTTRPIVVGYDGPPHSEAALDWAVAVAAEAGPCLVVLHAVARITYTQDAGLGTW